MLLMAAVAAAAVALPLSSMWQQQSSLLPRKQARPLPQPPHTGRNAGARQALRRSLCGALSAHAALLLHHRRIISPPCHHRTLERNASHLGWGGVLDGTVPAQGMWTGRARGRHINFLELMAVHHTLQVVRVDGAGSGGVVDPGAACWVGISGASGVMGREVQGSAHEQPVSEWECVERRTTERAFGFLIFALSIRG